MKKILIVSLCFVLIAIATVQGTLSASKANDRGHASIVSGAVNVAISEEQRSDVGLVPLAPTAILLPDPNAYAGSPALTPTLPVLWHDGSEVLFWEKLPRACDKIVSVTNTSSVDAFVRIVFAFENVGGVAEHLRLNVADPSALGAPCHAVIDGVPYILYTYTYEGPLAAGSVSAPSLLQFVFDSRLSVADLGIIGDAYDILISAEAVQTGGFDDATAALNAMFGEVNAENHPWLDHS